MNSAESFRAQFPALARFAWFDTPAAPPGHVSVTQALETALRDWTKGTFHWSEWDIATESVRDRFARLVGTSSDDIAVLHSVSEFVATIARSEPKARVVMLADEFRSVRFPLDGEENAERVRFVDRLTGETRTDALLRSLFEPVDYVIASEVLAGDGDRLDVPAIMDRCRALGACLVLDASQSLGALTVPSPLPDAYVCHTYKWMVAPRGITLAYVAPALRDRLRPLAPGWTSTVRPHGFYGGPYVAPSSARKLDASPSWFPMVGTATALEVMLELDLVAVEVHTLGLADTFRSHIRGLPGIAVRGGVPSHIVALECATDGLADEFAQRDIRCTVANGFFRVGFHYFNSGTDIDRLIAAVDATRKA